jgi:hypothetical protein
VGLSLEDEVPDHTTLCRFRNRLVSAQLLERLFGELDRQLEASGLVLKQGALLDATLIEAATSRPRKGKEAEARDPDAAFVKRQGKVGSTYGYKAHVGVDQGSGLVRAVITLLLQQPVLGREVEPPFAFADLEVPGIGLMVALLETIHARPDISTALLLEAFETHADYPALQKLALTDMPGDEAIWRQEFLDAIAQLNRQARQQRLSVLRQRMAQSGLSMQETEELRDLLKPN